VSGLTFADYSMKLHDRGGHEVTFQIARQGVTGSIQYNAWLSDQGRYIIQERDISDSTNITNKYYYGANKANFSDDWTNRAALTYVEYYEIYDNLA